MSRSRSLCLLLVLTQVCLLSLTTAAHVVEVPAPVNIHAQHDNATSGMLLAKRMNVQGNQGAANVDNVRFDAAMSTGAMRLELLAMETTGRRIAYSRDCGEPLPFSATPAFRRLRSWWTYAEIPNGAVGAAGNFANSLTYACPVLQAPQDAESQARVDPLMLTDFTRQVCMIQPDSSCLTI